MRNNFYLYGILLCDYINSRCKYNFFFDSDTSLDLYIFTKYPKSITLFKKHISNIVFITRDIISFRSAIAILEEELSNSEFYFSIKENTVSIVYYDYLIVLKYDKLNTNEVSTIFHNNIALQLLDIDILLSIKLSQYTELDDEDILKILSVLYLLKNKIQYNNILIHLLKSGSDTRRIYRYMNRIFSKNYIKDNRLCNVSIEKQLQNAKLLINFLNA